MRVAVDATPLYGPRTGVGVFTAELLARLADRPDLHVAAYAVTWRGRNQLAGRVPDGVRAVGRPMAARPLRLAWRYGRWPPIEWFTGTVDVVHGVNYVVPPTSSAGLASVHDLTTVHFPELCTADTRQFPALVQRAFARGAHLHTGSQFVADEIAQWLSGGSERIHVVPYGVSADDVSGGDASRGQTRAGAERYVLALGTIEPRKDVPMLVRAFDALAADDNDVRLVVAGPDGWGVEAYAAEVRRARHRDRVVRLGWVDDRARADLLSGAAVFAYPSRYEGFGLPPLEAMAAGVPVVTTRAGAIPEAVGEAAELVEPGDVDGLAAALARVLSDEHRRAALVAAGRTRVQQFTWDRCAQGLVDVYRALAPGAGP